MNKKRALTPAEFYKIRRPEYFSDSEIIYEVKLQREHLAYELSQISTNQKHDEFETLCRRLAEKYISPNLIPQVGPTGGGDGKTDSETYPLSTAISDRWFVPESGWEKDEKWGFAFSAKKSWKSKAQQDIKKIVDTNRGYTRVYFITNQKPSSKKKKEAQEEFTKEFRVDVQILDGEWIIEKILNNDLIELVVDSLNLSDVFKNRKVIQGQNDAYRLKKLTEIENKINYPNRYFECDFQLVEDTLEAAILSRMLEKSRDEVLGKFDRAFRFCKKVNNKKQWIRLYYQRAWTFLNWYDDYSSFLDDFKNLKNFISKTSSITEIEFYFNLFNLLRGLDASGNYNLKEKQIDILIERKAIDTILNEFIINDHKPCSSLIAKTYKLLLGLTDSILKKDEPDMYLNDLSNIISQSGGFLDYPFESFKKILEELGDFFPSNIAFDNLIDCIAIISEKRNSELAAGETFLKRGGQKLYAKYYSESVSYFGKAVLKLAKEESKNGMYFSLVGLAKAYSSLGLLWASNNCLIAACSISFKSLDETGIIDKRTYDCVKQLTKNELYIGRIPSFLSWHELFKVLSKKIDIKQENKDIPSEDLMDACFANRILNTNNKENDFFMIPDLLESQELWISQNASLYKLGYIEIILDDYKGENIIDEKSLDTYFKKLADQPFKDQMIYETNYMVDNQIKLSSTILGCKFIFRIEKDIELLLAAETLLAFLESFLATSLKNVYPSTESIVINCMKTSNEQPIKFRNRDDSSEYMVEISSFIFNENARDKVWTSMLGLVSQILATNFIINDPEAHLENLFKKEEIIERLSLIFEHRKFTINILGTNPKLFLNDWIKTGTYKEYPMKRETPIIYEFNKQKEALNSNEKINPENIRHDKIKAISIIDVNLWNQAKWKGFGFFGNSASFGIFIAYRDIEAGKRIFDNWIERFGREDKDEVIRIAIIKGVDKNNPFWYRVHISSNIDEDSVKTSSFIVCTSRFHEMNANSSRNLDYLIGGYNKFKRFQLCPALIEENGKINKICFDKAIIKKALYFRNAWEIGELDIDSVVIKKGDAPIIPADIMDAPVLKVLKKRNY